MDNVNDDELSVYELGIIKNALRGRVADVEAFRTEFVLEKEEADMNSRVDAFQVELINIYHKIENIDPEEDVDP